MASNDEPQELWEKQLQELLDAHPGRGGKTVVANEIGVMRQVLNLWLPMGATGKRRQSPNYQNRVRIQEAWERIVRPRKEDQ